MTDRFDEQLREIAGAMAAEAPDAPEIDIAAAVALSLIHI